MTTIKGAEHHLAEAVAAIELAGQQQHSPAAMAAHTNRAAVLLKLHTQLLERELAGLAPIEAEPPIAVQDAHGRTWVRELGGWWTSGTQAPIGSIEALSARFGPLRPVGAANR